MTVPECQHGFSQLVIMLLTLLVIVIISGGAYFIVITQKELHKEKILDAQNLNTVNTNSGEITNWKIYKNEKLGFEVKYPPDWKQVDIYDGGFGFLPPNREVALEYNGDIRVFIKENPKGLSFKEFYNGINAPNLYKDVTGSIEATFIDGREATRFNNVIGLRTATIIVIPLTDQFIELESSNNFPTIFNSFVASFRFDETVDWRTYRNEKFRLEIKHPQEFHVEELPNLVSILNYDPHSPNMPDEPISEELRRKLFKMEIVWLINSKRLNLQEWITEYQKNSTSNLIVINTRSLTVDGQPAIWSTESFFGRVVNVIYVAYGNNVYLFSGVRKGDQFEDTSSKIIENFRFTANETASWQTYLNEEVGIEFKYPPKWIVKERQWGQFHLMSPNDAKIFNAPGYTDQPLGFGISTFYTSYQLSLEEWLANRFNLSLEDIAPTDKRKNDIASIKKVVIGDNYEGYLLHELGLVEGSYSHFTKSGEVIVDVAAFYQHSLTDPLFQNMLTSIRFINTNKTKDWKTYKSPNLGYSIQYPSSWTASSLSDIYSEFNNPQSDDDYIRNQNVGAPLEMTYDGVWMMVEQYSLDERSFEKTIVDLSKKYDIVSKESIVINGYEAVRQVESDKPDFEGEVGYHVVTYIYTGGKVYKLSVLAFTQDPYKNNETIVNRMIRSFEIN